MNAINNSGFLQLFAVSTLTGFTPSVSYSLSDSTLTVTDNSTYASGDGLKIVHIHVTDSEGGVIYSHISTTGSGGAVAINVSTLNNVAGFNVTCTVVSNNRAIGDLSMYGIGSTAPAAGNMFWPNKQLG
jgi:hypothetical protein